MTKEEFVTINIKDLFAKRDENLSLLKDNGLVVEEKIIPITYKNGTLNVKNPLVKEWYEKTRTTIINALKAKTKVAYIALSDKALNEAKSKNNNLVVKVSEKARELISLACNKKKEELEIIINAQNEYFNVISQISNYFKFKKEFEKDVIANLNNIDLDSLLNDIDSKDDATKTDINNLSLEDLGL